MAFLKESRHSLFPTPLPWMTLPTGPPAHLPPWSCPGNAGKTFTPSLEEFFFRAQVTTWVKPSRHPWRIFFHANADKTFTPSLEKFFFMPTRAKPSRSSR